MEPELPKEPEYRLAHSFLNTLPESDRINGTLFAAMFSDIDELRIKLEKIPADVDGAADRFHKITVQAVDQFVTVANEALGRFMQRTNEIKAVLVNMDRALLAISPTALASPASSAPAVAHPPKPKIAVANSPTSAAVSARPASSPLPVRPWWTMPVVVGASFLLGIVLACGGLLWAGVVQLSRS